MALTAARVQQILSQVGKIRRVPNPQPYTEEELTALRLEMDWRYLFPPRMADDSAMTAKLRPNGSCGDQL